MKLNYLLFFGGIVLIAIGLWDYYALRIMDDIPRSEEEQQLVPSIVGAILLVFSPLFEQRMPKWALGLVCLFLTLTAIIFLSTALRAGYSSSNYLLRHLIGVVFIVIIIIANIRSIKQGEAVAK